jgi:hypothetical protein
VRSTIRKLEEQAKQLGHITLGSIWRLYACYQKPRHEKNLLKQEEKKVSNINRRSRKESYVKKEDTVVKRKGGKRSKAKEIKSRQRTARNKAKKRKLHKTVDKGEKTEKLVGIVLNLKTCLLRKEAIFCVVCSEKYAPNEVWVQCTECTMWAHWGCAGKDPR